MIKLVFLQKHVPNKKNRSPNKNTFDLHYSYNLI